MPGLVLQALPRNDDGPARLGFTVTKKIGNAVIRNRTRRRLKEAARLVLADQPLRGVDLVLIGREGTAKRDFGALQDDFRRAMTKALRSSPRSGQGGLGRMTPAAHVAVGAVRVYQWTVRPVDRRELPVLAELQRLRDRRLPRPWGAARQRAGGAAHPALQSVARRRLRSGPGACDCPNGAVMDQKRLFLAIAISLAILLGFQVLIAPHLPQPPQPPQQIASSETTPTPTPTVPAQGSPGAAARPPARPCPGRCRGCRSRPIACVGRSACSARGSMISC